MQTCPVAIGHHFLSTQKLQLAHIATFLIRVPPPPTFLIITSPSIPPTSHSFPSTVHAKILPSDWVAHLTVLDNNYRYFFTFIIWLARASEIRPPPWPLGVSTSSNLSYLVFLRSGKLYFSLFSAVLWIRISMFLGLPDLLVTSTDPALDPEYGSGYGSFHHEAKIVRKSKNLDFYCIVISLWLFTTVLDPDPLYP